MDNNQTIDDLLEQIKQEKDAHYWTMNALELTLKALKSNVDKNSVITDIETFFKDIGRV